MLYYPFKRVKAFVNIVSFITCLKCASFVCRHIANYNIFIASYAKVLDGLIGFHIISILVETLITVLKL